MVLANLRVMSTNACPANLFPRISSSETPALVDFAYTISTALRRGLPRRIRFRLHFSGPLWPDRLLHTRQRALSGTKAFSKVPVHQAHCHVHILSRFCVRCTRQSWLHQSDRCELRISKRFSCPNSSRPEYWTTTNIANGLNALCTCCEVG